MRHDNPKTAIRGATALSPIAENLDVSRIATRGHVNAARLSQVGRWGFLPAVLFAGLGLWALWESGPSSFGYESPAPAWLISALTYDPSTYFDLGGGLRGGPNEAWLAAYKPKPESLTLAQYDKLVDAVRTDLAEHGGEPSQWATVAALDVRPQITRPERVFADHSARLQTGVVAIPEHNPTIALIVSHVAGEWGVTGIHWAECKVYVGPVPEGCIAPETEATDEGTAALFGMAQRQLFGILADLKPAPKTESEE